ncbi:C6 transcription factor [Apiospora arundinis]
MPTPSVAGLVGVLVVSYLVYQFLKAIYNISPLHPLSRIPGPWLSSATYLPEFWWDVIQNGRYTRKIEEMHRKYGPIVRISPNELHCNDINFGDEIYAVGGRKRDKPLHQVNGSILNLAEFGTVDHDIHRSRRAPVGRFFSRSMISRLESDVKTLVRKLCDKLLAQKGEPAFDIAVAYSCFTADAISGYAFGQGFGLLDQPGWEPNFHEPTLSSLRPGLLFRFFPFMKNLAEQAVHFVDYLPTSTGLFIRELQINIPNQIRRTKADLDAGLHGAKDHPTIFAELYNTTDLQEDEKTVARLAAEALGIVGAGTETTSWTLAVITYHLLSQPQLLARLTKELQDAQIDPLDLPHWTELEKLPFLKTVIQEGLRLSYGVSARTARIATQEDLLYHGEWNKKSLDLVIPRGYAVGMSSAIVHHDERIFRDSHRFAPDRWCEGSELWTPDTERGMFSFSKGSRSCLGMNLSLCEMNLALTALTLRVLPHMRIYETDESDIRYDHDMFIPMPKSDTKGVRVTIE